MAAVTGGIMAGASLLGVAATSSAERKAGKDKAKAAEAAAQRIAEQIQQARGNIQQLTPGIEANILAGTQAGLGTLQQGLGQRMQAFQGGNVAAQNLIGQGMPQYQAALLGLGMPQAPQAYQQQIPQINYQLPEFVSTAALMEGEARAATPASELIAMGAPEMSQEKTDEQALSEIPRFEKSDYSKVFVNSGAFEQKVEDVISAVNSLSDEQFKQLRRQGPKGLGLGGTRGTRLYNKIMSERGV